MSRSSTETTVAHPARSSSLIQSHASPLSASGTPKPIVSTSPKTTHSPRPTSTSYSRDVIGLGITTDDCVDGRLNPSPVEASLKSPVVRTRTLSGDIGELGLRINTSHSVLVEVRADCRPADAIARPLPGDGQDSVASSIRKYRTSTDSATTVSTLPTTPGPRMSIASDFSRSLSFKSPIGSARSTPAHSRSPSPPQLKITHGHREHGQLAASEGNDVQRKRSFARRSRSFRHRKSHSGDIEGLQSSDDQTDRKPRARSGLLRRKSHQSASTGPVRDSITDNEAPKPAKADAPAVPPLPKSFSSDRLHSLRLSHASGASGRSTPVPRLLPSDRTGGGHAIFPRKKDELWSVFRALDADFSKFSSKSIAFKAGVVRSSLLPLLRTYATHSSNQALRPEDLDRRANILNKWWTGLIELLHGRNNQSISGTDRPAILDGISGIMDRSEWRLSPSPFCPLEQRTKGTAPPSPKALASSTSDFLADSVHQNVRNTFVQNLSAQMAFVVDKMSLRNASASLVTFCGKACAYAFMFVPGMADVLTRVWDLHYDPLKRVLQAYEIGKFDDVSHLAEAVVHGFPPTLHHLAVQSLAKYMRKLRTSPPLPTGTADIEWSGHWLERWSGRESDLFYVFVKHFHILASTFLDSHATRAQRICAPGMLLVQAQILVNLDATIHRASKMAQQDPIAAAAPTSGPDGTSIDPDAVVSAFTLPPTNATRLMAENRLIMLIRDFLSERTSEHPAARQLFAENFNDLLQACTTGTPLFDHASCYTLLDFLEEALVMLVRFDAGRNDGRGSLIDLDFWTAVWKKMLQSHNTMTEIRLYSFLYTVWNTIICESGWKANVCFNMLLDADVFSRTFNHWCPMVRAYFMRLLCWRVARHDGDYSSVDLDILETLAERLRNTWSHYLFLRGLAELEGREPPLTNPCYPVPSRRLLIVRTDASPCSPASAFLSFDGLRSSPKASPVIGSQARQRSSTVSQVAIDTRPGSAWSDVDTSDGGEQRGRGVGGFLRSLMPNKARSRSRNTASRAESRMESATPPGLPNSGMVRSATDPDFSKHYRHHQRSSSNLVDSSTSSATVKGPTSPTGSSASSSDQNQVPPVFRKFSFKFSLEFTPASTPRPLPPMRLQPPRLPLPAQQFLVTYSDKASSLAGAYECAVEPQGEEKAHARYCGRALAEWTLVLGECASFFERRRTEGVGERRWVETPVLGVEVFGGRRGV